MKNRKMKSARPNLDRLLKQAAEAVRAMSPEERKRMHEAQRRSWVIGELMLQFPEMTRERAIQIYESIE